MNLDENLWEGSLHIILHKIRHMSCWWFFPFCLAFKNGVINYASVLHSCTDTTLHLQSELQWSLIDMSPVRNWNLFQEFFLNKHRNIDCCVYIQWELKHVSVSQSHDESGKCNNVRLWTSLAKIQEKSKIKSENAFEVWASTRKIQFTRDFKNSFNRQTAAIACLRMLQQVKSAVAVILENLEELCFERGTKNKPSPPFSSGLPQWRTWRFGPGGIWKGANWPL